MGSSQSNRQTAAAVLEELRIRRESQNETPLQHNTNTNTSTSSAKPIFRKRSLPEGSNIKNNHNAEPEASVKASSSSVTDIAAQGSFLAEECVVGTKNKRKNDAGSASEDFKARSQPVLKKPLRRGVCAALMEDDENS